ncbi:hypothetical protein [Aquirhabdus sp.]|uniref:hypothetical protein n=1 Tax=Aquirhabdus sp. TaxID=2824160 RepID=UPI00396CE946
MRTLGYRDVKLIIRDKTTDVFTAEGKHLFTIENRIALNKEKGKQVIIAVGGPNDWPKTAPRVLPPDSIDINLSEVDLSNPFIIDLWETFISYCRIKGIHDSGGLGYIMYLRMGSKTFVIETLITDQIFKSLLNSILGSNKRFHIAYLR